eukprot:TRINITY_DN2650_c0_g1_i1.p1 TRINITY_DN2650_c0_g1~~TRINITY_DN2650_c0_g1_i1.p1  ORF type:complete len:265 (+),score=16.76 TRINITY_DN2650_c0_g1_i1:69-797(+)
MEEEDLCCVCLSPFDNQTPITVLECRHRFHKNCIRSWYFVNGKCPYDQLPIPFELIGSISKLSMGFYYLYYFSRGFLKGCYFFSRCNSFFLFSFSTDISFIIRGFFFRPFRKRFWNSILIHSLGVITYCYGLELPFSRYLYSAICLKIVEKCCLSLIELAKKIFIYEDDIKYLSMGNQLDIKRGFVPWVVGCGLAIFVCKKNNLTPLYDKGFLYLKSFSRTQLKLLSPMITKVYTQLFPKIQ